MSSSPTTGERWRARAALVAALALTASAAGAQGCGFGEGERSEGEASLTVTRDYGAEVLVTASAEDPPAGDTVMRFLDREAEIETRFGGGFVQSLDGIEGSTDGGRRSDWFFYVNGTESPVGAAEVELEAGDWIWWDYHDWTDVMRVPYVVGSWPAPFAASQAAPVDCRSVDLEVCSSVSERIEAAGDGTSSSDIEPRVIVGPWRDVRDVSRASLIDGPPSRSGVFASFEAVGSEWELALFDETVTERDRLGAGAGLIAAVEGEDQQPVWLVTGTDSAGAEAAAGAFDEESLANRFAVAIPPGGEPEPLPVP